MIKDFSNIRTTLKPSPPKGEIDRGAEFFSSFFQNFSNFKSIYHNSRFRAKGSLIAERMIRSIRNLMKKPTFLAGNADSVSELPPVVEQYNITIHTSTN